MRRTAESLRGEYQKRAWQSTIVAMVVGTLMYKTQWFSLHLGLLILLVTYAVVAFVSFRRVRATGEPQVAAYRRLSLFEAAFQGVGCLVVGYGIWRTIGSVGLAAAVGVLYPAAIYFGVIRVRDRAALRGL